MDIKEFQNRVLAVLPKDPDLEDMGYDNNDLLLANEDFEMWVTICCHISAKYKGISIPCEHGDWSVSLDDICNYIERIEAE